MEKTIYRSGMSKGVLIFIFIIMLMTLGLMIFLKAWPGIFIDIGLFAFIGHLFATTYYVVSGDTLKVRSGFIINITINIATVTRIEQTDTMLSAPALSFDRLEVFYNKYDSV